MLSERVILGLPLDFGGICKIYPPKTKEVIGSEHFGFFKKIMTISQEELEDIFTEKGLDLDDMLTPLEYLISNAYNSKDAELALREGFKFFTKESITILPEKKTVIIGDLTNLLQGATNLEGLQSSSFLSETNYFDFQNMIRTIVGESVKEPPILNEHPKIKKMKAKARYRDRVKAESGQGLSLSASLLSISCMNLGLNPLNIGEIPYATIGPLIERYQEKQKYENGVQSILAGADSKKVKLKNWVRNIEET